MKGRAELAPLPELKDGTTTTACVLKVTTGKVELKAGELDTTEVVEGNAEVFAVGSFVAGLGDTDSLAQVTPASSL